MRIHINNCQDKDFLLQKIDIFKKHSSMWMWGKLANWTRGMCWSGFTKMPIFLDELDKKTKCCKNPLLVETLKQMSYPHPNSRWINVSWWCNLQNSRFFHTSFIYICFRIPWHNLLTGNLKLDTWTKTWKKSY